MKKLLIGLMLFVCVPAFGQGIIRNSMTTNSDAVVLNLITNIASSGGSVSGASVTNLVNNTSNSIIAQVSGPTNGVTAATATNIAVYQGLLAAQAGSNFSGVLPATTPWSWRESENWSKVHQQRFTDATNIVENWANLDQWNSTNVVVTNGTLVSLNAGNPATAVFAFPMSATDEARIVTSIVIPATHGTGFMLVGFSSDPAGQIQAPSGTSGVGIGYDGTKIFFFIHGTSVEYASGVSPGTYPVIIQADTNNVSFCIQFPNHTDQFLTNITRAAATTINNVWIFNGDNAFTLGTAFGPLSAKKATETSSQRIGIETSDTFVRTVDDFSQNIAFWFPSNYDSRVPAPMLVYCHGFGASFMDMYNDSLENAYHKAFITNGWIVASGDFGGVNGWGNSNSMFQVTSFMNFAKRHYNIGPVWFQGTSMGGMTALNWIGQHQGQADGFVGISPVCNLFNQHLNPSYTATIDSAYGVTGIGTNTYANNTAGYDPFLMHPAYFSRVPMQFYYDTLDPLVVAASNSVAFSAQTTGFSRENDPIVCPGAGHAGPGTYQSTNVMSFMDRLSYSDRRNIPLGISGYLNTFTVGNQLSANSLSVTRNITTPTNSTTPLVDMTRRISDFSTNNNFAFLGFSGLSTSAYQSTTVYVTNSSGSLKNFTVPANCYTNGSQVCNVTNVTEVIFKVVPGRYTNAQSNPWF